MRKYDLGHVEVRKRSRLPHWHADYAINFVTWNLFDALPASVLARLRAEREAQREMIFKMRGSVTIPEQRMLDAALTAACEQFLDQHAGECYLRDRRVARIVADSLMYFDAARYLLYAWCVMPNHVHAVFSCLGGFNKSSILHSLKGFTSKEINNVLGRSGTLWQAESYDRCVRDSEELTRTIDYVFGNPAAAGMEDWPFARMYPERIAEAI
jgi:REP element-mobilizing transposase RayT